jgi:hypothetical protein
MVVAREAHISQDMHYAEFAEDEVSRRRRVSGRDIDSLQSAALLNAIKEYEMNKWKSIGAKLGKPAKVYSAYIPSI